MKAASVSPTTVKVTETLASGVPRLLFARTLIRSAKASPAVAVSSPVPAFCTAARTGDGVGVGVGVAGELGSVGVGLGFAGGFGAGVGVGVGVGEGDGVVCGVPGPMSRCVPVLVSTGRMPVPSGTSWVPRL